jgi:hypothetical protein
MVAQGLHPQVSGYYGDGRRRVMFRTCTRYTSTGVREFTTSYQINSDTTSPAKKIGSTPKKWAHHRDLDYTQGSIAHCRETNANPGKKLQWMQRAPGDVSLGIVCLQTRIFLCHLTPKDAVATRRRPHC